MLTRAGAVPGLRSADAVTGAGAGTDADADADASTLLAHEWISPPGGSENVFEELIAAFPGARACCLWNDAPARFPRAVEESWLARSPMHASKAAALPFMPLAWRSIDLRGVQTVVVSSHAFAHHLASRAARMGMPAYAYVHTPARYLWAPELDTRGEKPLARILRRELKRIDGRQICDRVSYAANSRFVRSRIRAAWGVDAEVIHPPVAVERIQSRPDWLAGATGAEARVLAALPAQFVLGASRLVPYKRTDLAISVGESVGLPVVVAGDGPLRTQLEAIASRATVPVHLLGRVSDAALYALYQRASLFVFMAVEDFGIMPAEAIAAGTPVLVNRVGGAAETVELTGGGVVADPADVSGLREAATTAMDLPMDGARVRVRELAVMAFRARVRRWTGREPADPETGGAAHRTSTGVPR